MVLPLGVFSAFGKAGYKLYCYFYNGPKIDVALTFKSIGRNILGPSHFNLPGKPASEMDFIWRFEVYGNYILTLKNSSRNPAYQIKLLNIADIFDTYTRIEKLAHLEPGQRLDLKVTFSQLVDMSNVEVDQLSPIPEEKLNQYLLISYQNEARTTFYTKSKISDRETDNQYFLKLPKI